MASYESEKIFVLEGQGTIAATSQETTATAFSDAQSPLGYSFLQACHQAFIEELTSLSSDDQLACGLSRENFENPSSLIRIQDDFLPNAIIANVNLYLIQILRFLVSTSFPVLHESQAFPSKQNSASFAPKTSNIIGFSSGAFAACVIASSASIPSLFLFGVEAFKVAFWVGFRAEMYARKTLLDYPVQLSPSTLDISSPAPHSWSLISFGATKEDVRDAVRRFEESEEFETHLRVCIAAVNTSTCISLSGHPNALCILQNKYLPSTVISSKYLPIYTLYHSADLSSVRDLVMDDIHKRCIHFPSYNDLRSPILSTFTGGQLSSDTSSICGSLLVGDILDMILVHPINFDKILEHLNDDLASRFPLEPLGLESPSFKVEVVNFGPGMSLAKTILRSVPKLGGCAVEMLDHHQSLQTSSSLSLPNAASSANRGSGVAVDSIAIIGMAIEFPGAKDVDGLWDVLEKGLNTVSDIPSSRFDVSNFDHQKRHSSSSTTRQMKCHTGNFLEDPSLFDNGFFNISPREAKSMDPQQRLLLQVSYHALENAGYVDQDQDRIAGNERAGSSFDKNRFGVYVGVATNDYVQNLRNEVDVYYSTGTLQAFLSGKISYAFGFSGPSIVVDTACSSSMVALHQACRALTNGDCNAALAGGVNVITSPDMYIGLDRAHFLSPTGQCKPWDACADGYSRAEGCGMFVLKRLSDAVNENDRILGVIRGIEVNQSGNADSITHPHVSTQIALFERVVEKAGVDANDVGVVEAHGTGTKAGDPSEVAAIRAVFAKKRTPDNPLHLTAIKANIGHSEAASGAASLAKLLLMMHHRTIPPLISLSELNPNIPQLSSDHLTIDQTTVPWDSKDGRPRLALLNNFGAAGSNVALILEEPPLIPKHNSASSSPGAVILTFSCKTETAVEELRHAYMDFLEVDVFRHSSALVDLSYTTTVRRQLYPYRISVVGCSKEELQENLRRASICHVAEAKSEAKIVFVFSGQGSQFLGMGGGLYRDIPFVKDIIDDCHRKLMMWGYPGVLSVMLGLSGGNGEECKIDIVAYQCAIFVLEYALVKLWETWEVVPDAVVGHSLGEYAALVTAGVLSLDDALRLVAGRALLLKQRCPVKQTGMLAVKLSSVAVLKLLEGNYTLSIACHNSSRDCVVAGSLGELQRFSEDLKCRGHRCISVDVPFGAHSSAMDPLLDELSSLATRCKFSPPCIPIASTLKGSVVVVGDSSVFNADYVVKHCRQPVRFEDAVTALTTTQEFGTVSAWIEIGPQPTTLSLLKSIPTSSQHSLYLPSLRRGVSDRDALSETLSKLLGSSMTLPWHKIFADLHPNARLIDTPLYPFARNKYWVAYQESSPSSSKLPEFQSPRYTLLETCESLPSLHSTEPAIFVTSLATLRPFIDGHKVSDYGLCPASVYMELVAAAVHLVLEHHRKDIGSDIVALSHLSFPHALVSNSDDSRFIRVKILMDDIDSCGGSFIIDSSISGQDSQQYCLGSFRIRSVDDTLSKLSLVGTMLEHSKRTLLSGSQVETFYTRTLYNVIFSRIVSYAPVYQTVKSLTVSSDRICAYAEIKIPSQSFSGTFVTHPSFLDTLLHVAGFVINLNAAPGDAFICSEVDKVTVTPSHDLSSSTSYGVYCTVSLLTDKLAVADTYAVDLSTNVTIGQMKRIRFRKVKMSTFKSILSSSSRINSSPVTASPPMWVSRSHSRTITPSSTDTAISIRAQTQPTSLDITSIETRVKTALSAVLGQSASEIQEDSMFDLGYVESMEVAHTLSADLKLGLPDDLLFSGTNVRDMACAIYRFHSKQTTSPDLFSKAYRFPPLPVPPAQTASILQIMSSILGMPAADLPRDADLGRFGLDSLTSIEAHHLLSSTLKIDFPHNLFTKCKTVAELDHFIHSYPLNTDISMETSSANYCADDVKKVLSKVLGVPTSVLDDQAELYQLGMDSLMSIEAIHLLSRTLNLELPPDAFTACKTVHDLLLLVEPLLCRSRLPELSSETLGTNCNPLLFQSFGTNSLPLFLVHDGTGVAYSYRSILSIDRDLWGIHNPKFSSGEQWRGGIVEMAEHYAEMIKQTLSSSSGCIVGGWSGGGIIAYEVARKLMADGIFVPGIVLIDVPPPTMTTPNAILYMEKVRQQLRLSTQAVAAYDPTQSPYRHLQPRKAVMLRCRDGVVIPGYHESTEVETWLSDRSDPYKMVSQWEEVLGFEVPVLDVDGTHTTLFDRKNVASVSTQLREALRRLDMCT
ncbi:hypothetical protein ABKN59_009371 [Abortiporus biennis]